MTPVNPKMQTALVRSILEQWASYSWTVQGFGFIRTKIGAVGRIHVWDSRLTVPQVSSVHTHPWPLRSTIISGEIINQRFASCVDADGLPYLRSRIATGEGGGLIGDVEEDRLVSTSVVAYGPGDQYEQAPADIHRSIPQDGCITLLERPQGPPLEEALTFWPRGTEWVSAIPRPATHYEVERTVYMALARWNAL